MDHATSSDDPLRIHDLMAEHLSTLVNGHVFSDSILTSSAASTSSAPAPLPSTSNAPAPDYNYSISIPSYPPPTPHLHSSPISILSTPSAGRGVFASAPIPSGTLIEIAPVLVLSDEEYYSHRVDATKLKGYVFTWKGKKKEEKGMALALGLGSLFNHSPRPNINFVLHADEYTIHYTTCRAIQKGEELCIFYGHDAHFGQNGASPHSTDSDEDPGPWGGLSDLRLGEKEEEQRDFKTKKYKRRAGGTNASAAEGRWEDDIVLFDDLEWVKVTRMIDPEKIPLTTVECYVVDVPARHVPLALAFIKLYTEPYTRHHPAELSHLKRVRPLLSASSPSVSVLLFPVSSAPSNLSELLATHQPFNDVNITLDLYTLLVPATIARTDAQAENWGQLWPVQTMHIREGPKAKPRAQGWERCKLEWVRSEAEKVWRAAKQSRDEKGEQPIACHVTESFDPEIHSPTNLPNRLSSAHDTRFSTSNPLLHAIPNLIDSVAQMDRQNLRPRSSNPSSTPPYLLTGMTLFISHEPCLMCSMALLHSRIANVYYIRKAPGSGGCGSVFAVQEGEGLNHKFEVWEWRGEGGGIGEGLEVELDP
ncbi:BZ3500_MvSof-1268-A1-R1_Chr3-3g06540 [Microbotryum saponariae]|uniref:BZ3500_MvSof-1268-A1-R1_Chr3-3g06540 protein n=1 Tax=Microbotryum saponariae TaxID=289078 RepID=A0A2X0NH84_9BASI|nr:BZ3500_MvSof-1268-A1-R1_Chr3-3g06540 [Microbotryum saponariae]SDA04507.1 BZ3501_MvSof-1269-A2-R1_Chr3-2g06227 [Microbotryum saponariae]